MLRRAGGSELWLVNNDKYCGKVLFFEKQKKCSIHYHKLKDETFYVQKGKVVLAWSDIPQEFIKSDSVDFYAHKSWMDKQAIILESRR